MKSTEKRKEREGVGFLEKEGSSWTPPGSQGRPPGERVTPHCVLWVLSPVHMDLPGCWNILISRGQFEDPIPLSHPRFWASFSPKFLLNHPMPSKCISDQARVSNSRLDGRTTSTSCLPLLLSLSPALTPTWPLKPGLAWAFSWFLRIQPPSEDAFLVSGQKLVRLSFWFLAHLNDPF